MNHRPEFMIWSGIIYWSSTEVTKDDINANVIAIKGDVKVFYFNDGTNYPKNKSQMFYVRCVQAK